MEHTERNGDIDLRLVVKRLWERRLWIIAGACISTIVFAAAAFLMTPIYRASTVLVSASTDRSSVDSLGGALGQLGSLASLVGINIGSGGSQVEEALAVLKSREFTEAFIRDKNLLPVLFYKRWDNSTHSWIRKGPTLAKAYKFFNEKVRTVSQDKKTGLVTKPEIEWKDREIAAQWANELVARLNAEMRRRAIFSTNAAIGYLQRELANTTVVDTRQTINRLMEAQINQRMVANVTEQYAFRVVDRALVPDRSDMARPKRPFSPYSWAGGGTGA